MKLLTKETWVIIGAFLLVTTMGLALDQAPEQAQRSQRHADKVHTATQPPAYTGAPQCLTEDVALAPECNERRELPECLAEDGSGPGVYCFWTDPDGTGIWFNDGVEGNDQ